MIAEQLQAARSAHWRQNQTPLLTLDDAQSWLQQHPLCLYLPRHAQLPAPAPSFVEACLGSHQSTPGPDALQQAQSLLVRLVASGTVVPLNLFGTVSEQPDFLAHTDALPFVLSLRADADWKHAPQKSSGHKVSPLVLELWKTVEKDGGVTAIEAREALGRELTEAAVLRGLCELWQTLRISPVYTGVDEPVRWEMMRVQHRAALATAGNTGQVTALSLLVSMYLQSVYAASGDEMEVFLSPVTSRSRVREAVRGLAATRQIHSLSMDAQTFYFLEGGLPEFAELPASEPEEQALAEPGERRRPMPAPRKVQATRPAAGSAPEASPEASPGLGAPTADPKSEPIFRRPKPVPPPPAARPAFRPEARGDRSALDRPAARPYAKRADAPEKAGGSRPSFAAKRSVSPADRRPPARPGDASSRPPQRAAGGARGGSRPAYSRPATGSDARPGSSRPGSSRPGSSRPPYSRPSTSGTEGGEVRTRRPEGQDERRSAGQNTFRNNGPRPGSRPPSRTPYRSDDRAGGSTGARPPARAGARPGGRPGSGFAARPGARAASRPGTRPGASTGAAKREAPKPWALPGRKSGGPPRPPRPGGRGEAPFRPRAPRGAQGSEDSGQVRPARSMGRPQGGSAKPYRANRPAGATPGNFERPARPAKDGPRTYGPGKDGQRGAERGPRANRPRTTGTAGTTVPGEGRSRPPRPPFTPGGAARKPGFSRSSRPSGPPRDRASGPPRDRTSGPPRDRTSGPAAGRTAGPGRSSGPSARTEGRPAPGGGSGRPPRPPFASGRPTGKPGFSRSSPKPGGPGGKAKPSGGFRDRRPDRKKPEA